MQRTRLRPSVWLVPAAVFAAVVVFTLFNVDHLVDRGVADLRPMFMRLPLLLIGFVSAMILVHDAAPRSDAAINGVVLTLSVPVSMSVLGTVDWGPVAAGYLGVALVAMVYLSLRTCVLARIADRRVACVVTAIACFALYKTDHRFEAIARGVIDVRTVSYYVSLGVLFFSLAELIRRYDRNNAMRFAVVCVGLVVLNMMLAPRTEARLDTTRGNRQTLTAVTQQALAQLDASVRVRAFVSRRGHPALAGLVVELRDVLREFVIMGAGRVHVEFVEPPNDDAAIQALNDRYGLVSFPAELADDQTVDSYFSLLVEVGDRHQVLDVSELTTRVSQPGQQVRVRLRNVEYSITHAIRSLTKVTHSTEQLLAKLGQRVSLTLFASPGETPVQYREFRHRLMAVGADLHKRAPRWFSFDQQVVASAQTERQLLTWGIKPIQVSGKRAMYFHPVLRIGDSEPRLLMPNARAGKARIGQLIDHELRRAANARQLIAVHGQRLDRFRAQLALNYQVEHSTLRKPVAAEVRVLIVAATPVLDDAARRHVDQFLMRGGTLIVFASRYHLEPRDGLALAPLQPAMAELLHTYGVQVSADIISDQRAESVRFPIIEPGNNKAKLLEVVYPLFIEVAAQQRAGNSPFGRNVNTLIVPWASSLTISADVAATTLLRSSPQSWTQAKAQVRPDMTRYPSVGFAPPPATAKIGPFTLGVVVNGPMNSHFDAATQSHPDARLIVIGSADFVSDYGQLSGQQLALSKRYLNNVVFLHHAIDWALGGAESLAIVDRPAPPRIDIAQPTRWQALAYGLVFVLALLLLGWRKLVDGLMVRTR